MVIRFLTSLAMKFVQPSMVKERSFLFILSSMALSLSANHFMVELYSLGVASVAAKLNSYFKRVDMRSMIGTDGCSAEGCVALRKKVKLTLSKNLEETYIKNLG